jgi:hypothetical protein
MKKNFCLLIVLSGALMVGGCDNQNVDQKAVDAGVNRFKVLRPLYEKAQGNWDNLTAEDKETFIDMHKGNEESAKKTFDFMKGPPGGPGPQSGAPGR